ncbi:MAG TPA: hypothetical protein VJU60_12265 [Thermoleophilaceae bacterium]|nr:hypothetical protein [Thermoleophilaceae bacterium]
MPRFPSLLVGVCFATSLIAPAAASAGIFGTPPIPISVGPHGEAANGPSGHPTISGDDRKARYVAFDSAASNLVANDVNGRTDVFVWGRPHGRAGLRLSRPARPSGTLIRASVSSHEVQGNGDSMNPSLDGSMHNRPHCVAFQSTSTNLAPGDADAVEDVFVRNFSHGTTRLISRGIGAPAVNPSIDGNCGSVAFQAGGMVFVARVRGGRPHLLGSGSNPSYAKDGSAIVWQQGGGIMLRAGGHTVRVADSGSDPHVSDRTAGEWGVVFQTGARLTGNDTNPGSDVYMRVIRGGHVRGTDLISASRRGAHSLGGTNIAGGITAFGALRGIVTFANDEGGQDTLYYRNNHTGNIDDLAHASAAASIFDVATSARANFVAFSSTFSGFRFDHNGAQQDVFFKALRDGSAL